MTRIDKGRVYTTCTMEGRVYTTCTMETSHYIDSQKESFLKCYDTDLENVWRRRIHAAGRASI